MGACIGARAKAQQCQRQWPPQTIATFTWCPLMPPNRVGERFLLPSNESCQDGYLT